MKLAIDIPAETYKAISEWDEPKTKYAAEYMLYQFVKNGKRIELKNCSDAISRQAAIDAAKRTDYSGLAVEDVAKVTDEVVKNLKNLPPITEKTGRWIDGTDCSCCGFAFYDDVIDSKLLVGFKYCPNCGAKMEVEDG